MADDVNANIRINLDTSQALAGLQSLQSRISQFNQSVIQSNSQAVAAQRNLLGNFQAQVGASGKFSTSITNVENSVGRLQTAIDKNKLSMGQYFRYGVASSKNFGKVFRQENEQITRLATERVQRLQTQYVALGESQQGMTRAMKVRPLQLFNADSAIAIQRSQIFNKLLQDGSTSLVNWGKNTQWAGRQLMVGFSVPLSIFGGIAAKTFMELEEQAISFRKVYGDIFTTEAEVEENLAAVRELTQEMTKYGIAAAETFELANVAAQSGARGADLMAQTRQATRLAVLGQMEQQEAVKTTITLQNAFQLSNEDLADSINFLNIVENQSVLSLQDVAGAIPRVAPVIKSLGGDVRDLSVMLVAMREGGVSAAEGANALKTSLARLISPTAGASKMAKEMGINLDGIVEANQGDILGAVMQLAESMKELDELSGQRLLSEIFGKRQYARIGALFNNITNEASQAQRVLGLTTMSTEELAQTAEKELGAVEQSIATKFTAAVELLKTEIAPIGEQFLKLATPVVEGVGKILAKFNELSPTVKNFIAILTAGIGVVVPIVLMLVGLFGNLAGNLLKGVATLSGFFTRLRSGGEAVEYLAGNQLDAAAAAASLEGQVTGLTSSLNIQREAVDALTRAYNQYVAGANAAAASLPQGFRTPTAAPRTMATGGMVGGIGNKDTEPALLTPGEFVINADASKKFAPLLAAINEGKIGKYARGRTGNVSFGNLGDVELASVYDQRSLRAIQEMADSLSGYGDNIRLAFKSILEDLSQTQSLTKTMVQESQQLKQSQFPEISKMTGEKKYSYPGSESIEQSLTRVGIPSEKIQREIEVANISAQGAVSAVEDNADLLTKLGYAQEDLAVEANIARSHMQEVDKTVGLAAWEPDFWIAQSQAENQFLQTIQGSERNQQMLESYLVKQLDSTQDAAQLMQKIRSGVGLTENEFQMLDKGLVALLDDVKSSAARAEQIRSATSPAFIKGAVATSGAASARRKSGMLYETGRIAGAQTIRGLEVGTGSQSESRKAQKVANDVVDGFANQIARRSAEVQKSGHILGEKAVEGVKSGSSDIRVVLKESLGVGPLVEQEQANIKETIALRKAENKELQKRAMLLANQGYSPDVARRLAAQQLASERAAPAPAARGGAPFGLTMGPKSVQDDLIKATKQINNAGNQASQTAQRFSKLRGGITKFGGALKNGSMKMQGAFFALDGLVFAASMVNGSLGDMAQKALPVVFGLQGLTMVLPMLANPIGLAAVAVGGLIAGIIALDNANKRAKQKTIEYAIAVQGSAKAFEEFAKELGGIRPSEAFAKMASGVRTEEQQETFTRGQEFLQSESGQSMMGRIEMLSGQERINAIITELTQSIGFGIIDSATGKGIAQAIAVELKSPTLGFAVVSGISDYMRKTRGDTQRIVSTLTESISKDLDNVLNQYETTFEKEARLRELQLKQQERDLNAEEMQELIDLTDEAQSSEDDWRQSSVSARAAIGSLINASQKLADAQAMVNLKYREGKLDVEGYRYQTKLIEEQNKRVSDSIARLIEEAPADFMPALRRTALALGIPEEEVDAIETQYSNIVDTLVEDFNIAEKEAGKAGQAIAAALQSGTLDPGVAGSISTLLANQEYSSIIRIAIEGQPEKLPEILNLLNRLEQLPDPYKREILAELNAEGDLPSQRGQEFLNNLLSQLDELTTYTTYFAENPVLSGQAFEGLREGVFTTEQVSNAEKLFNELNSSKQVSDIFDFSNVDLDTLIKSEKTWESLGKKKDITATLKVNNNFSRVMKEFEVSYKQLDSLPDIVKRAILLKLDVQAELDLKVQDTLNADIFSAGATSGAAMQQSAGLQEIRNLLQSVTDGFDGGDDDNGGGGGGGGTESWLEGLRKEIAANLKLFVGNVKKDIPPIMSKLQGLNLPVMLLEQIGAGPDGLARAKELLDLSAEELKKFIKRYSKSVIGEFLAGQQIELVQSEQVAEARTKLQGMNVAGRKIESSVVEQILKDENAILTVLYGSNAQIRQMVKNYRQVAENLDPIETKLEQMREEFEKPIRLTFELREAQFQAAFNELDRLYEPQLQSAQKNVEALEDQRDAVQEQIDGLQKLQDADQRRIRGLQRQITMLERQKEAIQDQIDDLEYQNELDQRRIDSLNREDEMRRRVSEKLSRELDIMSRQEEKIRQAYQRRIDALDKVAALNDYILSQQRGQLGLAQAISTGDIYAATAAAQGMRQESAQFAQQQLRTGLETGAESAVAGLRTSEGLTREQAEARILAIEEQSYQTSLKTRDIEDRIYERNLQMLPLKDQMREIDEQIKDVRAEILAIEDIMYDRETQILDIEQNRLNPINDALAAEQQKVNELNEELQSKKDALTIDNLTYKQHQDALEAFEDQWRIMEANAKIAQQQGKQIGSIVESLNKATEAANEFWKAYRGKGGNSNISPVDVPALDIPGMPERKSKGGEVVDEYVSEAGEVVRIANERFDALGQQRQSYTNFVMEGGTAVLTQEAIEKGYGGIPASVYAENSPNNKFAGGMIKKYAIGGSIFGNGSRDSVPSMLTPGEFVIRKAMVDKYGTPMMRALNQGSFAIPSYDIEDENQMGVGAVNNNVMTNINAPVYNTYDMKFAINGTNQSADEIANQVMFKMRQIQDQGLRGNRGY